MSKRRYGTKHNVYVFRLSDGYQLMIHAKNKEHAIKKAKKWEKSRLNVHNVDVIISSGRLIYRGR